MMYRSIPLTALALAALTLVSCRKEKEETVNNGYMAAIDQSLAENFFNDMLKQADQVASDNGLRGALDGCIESITIDTTSMPYTILIDFGDVNCTGQDGLERRGAIAVSFTGPYRAIGTVITLQPQGYYVNDHLIQGTKTVTNLGDDSDGNTHFSITVDGTVTAPDASWTSSHQAQRVRTWIAGEASLTPFDDVYLITGSGSGVDRQGRSYSLQIIDAVRVEIGCPWAVAGTLSITPQDLSTRYVDLGNGSCDATFTVTVNGFTFTVG
ncbi:MAG: hypothetical protein KDB88_01785 [Flavobacteriales bacterium]|nr:hypothetical protein [Flavobacteriales bacterium]MCB0793440.1 hypothetical protein [Flavobacteriales bacterium]